MQSGDHQGCSTPGCANEATFRTQSGTMVCRECHWRALTSPSLPSRNPKSAGPARTSRVTFSDSGSPAVAWWDHERNAAELFATATPKARRTIWWLCPVCGHSFEAKILEMSDNPTCPACEAERDRARAQQEAVWMVTPVSTVPELMAVWADEADPHTVMVFGDWTARRFRCTKGHHPALLPSEFLRSGCPSCRGLATRDAKLNPRLADALPEIASQWHPTRNEALTPGEVTWNSKREVWWRDPNCGHEWQATIRSRDKYQRYRCPDCMTILDSLAYRFPSLATEWSPGNPVSAWHVRPHGKTIFTPLWVCSTNPQHVWQAPLSSRANGSDCPECRVHGKSRVELDHHEAAVAVFGAARSGAKVQSDRFRQRPTWLVDILVELPTGESLVIEYDGAYWHQGGAKRDVDIAKSNDLLAAEYRVVRLRERPLPTLGITHSRYLEVEVHSAAPNPTEALRRVQEWLGSTP